jgi:hypothetical protein
VRCARAGEDEVHNGSGVSGSVAHMGWSVAHMGTIKTSFSFLCSFDYTATRASLTVPCICVQLRLYFVFACGLVYTGAGALLVGGYEMTHAG